MSRSLTSGFAALLATRSHTRCTMLRLDLRDGSSIGITDHDRDLSFDLGDGAIEYGSRTGILTSDVSLATGLEADNYEVTGPIGDTVTMEAVLGGRLDRAEARLFQVNHRNPGHGALRLMSGNVAGARVEGGRFILEIRNQFDRYNQVVGSLITNRCKADFGVAATGCHGTPVTAALTVTAAASAIAMSVGYAGDHASGFFDLGVIEAQSGALAGTLPMEIFRWTQTAPGTADVVLFAPLAEAPAVGDTFEVRQGCPRTRAACMERGQILNFRGYPEVPGSNQVFKMPVPGQGDA